MPSAITLLPPSVEASAHKLSAEEFEADLEAKSALLVRVKDAKDPIAVHLQRSCENATADRLGKRSNTSVGSEPRMLRRSLPPAQRPAVLAQMLREGPFFVFPIRFEGVRLSVGRGREHDIVLYHKSVSRFHAWINSNSDGRYFLAENGSANGTHVNGKPIRRGTLVDIHPGDWIVFGEVKTLFCKASTLWEVLKREIGHRR